MSQLGTYWGLTGDDWRTISIVVQGFIAILLTVIGVVQVLTFFRSAQDLKMTRSLEACDRFTNDPIINTTRRTLFEAQRTGDLEKDPYKFRQDIVTMLNFFECIARGIEWGVYDEAMVHDHLSRVVRTYVKKFLTGDIPRKIDLPISSLANQITIDLAEKWDRRPGEQPIAYHETLLSSRLPQEDGQNVYRLMIAD